MSQGSLYFENFPVGVAYETGTRTLSLEEIAAFAREWAPQPFHLDQEAAEASIYGGIVASGFQTLPIGFNLCYDEWLWAEASMGSPGLSDLKWQVPVRPGDTLRVQVAVLESVPSASWPDRGG